MLEDNHKIFDDNKNLNKFTPALSFVDEETMKHKKGLTSKLNKKNNENSNQPEKEKIINEEKHINDREN